MAHCRLNDALNLVLNPDFYLIEHVLDQVRLFVPAPLSRPDLIGQFPTRSFATTCLRGLTECGFSLGAPSFNRLQIEPPVVAQLKGWNLMLAEQPVDGDGWTLSNTTTSSNVMTLFI